MLVIEIGTAEDEATPSKFYGRYYSAERAKEAIDKIAKIEAEKEKEGEK